MKKRKYEKRNQFLAYKEFQILVISWFDCLFRAFIISCFRDEKISQCFRD